MNLILGADSMLGKQVSHMLPDVVNISHKYYDLIDFESCKDAFDAISFSAHKTVYNFCGYNGGVQFNLKYPSEIYYRTAQINLNVLRCCHLFRVDKVVSVIASCAYPDFGDKVLSEEDINNGEPNPTVECHGYAKRTLLYYGRQLYKEHGIKAVSAILTNCYGPGDRFDVERTKVVGAIIKKLCDAKISNLPSVTFFGSGKPRREIMFCRDAAKALIEVGKNYDDAMTPINIGSDQEITILDLVYMVARLVDYKGEIVWDVTKTDGQMRKKLDTTKMREFIKFEMTPLEEGLKETIKYYMDVGRYLTR